MRRNELYRVNRGNANFFNYDLFGKHLFAIGGVQTQGLGSTNLSGSLSSTNIGSGLSASAQASAKAAAQSGSSVGSGAKGIGGGSSGGGANWGAAAGMAAGALGNINTGDPRGMWDTLDPVYHLADGRESGVGNAFSDTGVMLTQAGLSTGNYYLALAGAAAKIVGGLANAAFGIKTNKAKLKNAEDSIKANSNFVSATDNFDDIKGPYATASGDIYEGGWFSGGKARRKNEEMKKRIVDASQWAYRSVDNNVDNIKEDQMNNLLANYAAYGGLLTPYGQFGGGSLGIMQNDKYLDTIENRTKALAQKNNTMNVGLGMKAFGGELGTNGTDFTNGLLQINEGDSHERNPLDGVPVGVDAEGIPNLVEEGETIFNNYVFSDRMRVPSFMNRELGLSGNKFISFAEASKKLAKESEQRPNDPISIAGLEVSLSKLADVQEAERAKKGGRKFMGLMGYCNGGKMGRRFDTGGVKPYAYDKSWEGFKYFDPKTQQYDKGYLDFVNNINQNWIDRIFSENHPYGSMDRYLAKNKGFALSPEQASALAQDKKYSDMHKAMAAAYDDYKAGIDPKTGKAADNSVWPDESWELNPYGEGWEERRSIAPNVEEDVEDVGDMTEEQEYNPQSESPQKKYATWMRYAPAVGAGIMTLTDALGLTNKPDYTGVAGIEAAARAAGYVPEVSAEPIGDYMRYTPFDRQFHTNQLLASSRATDRALSNSSSPSKAAGIIANGYNTTLSLGNLARQAEEYNRGQYERTKEFNRKTNMFNSQMGLEEAMANARYSQQARQLGLSGMAQAAALRDSIDQRTGAARSANIINLLNNLGAIGRENFVFNQINSDRSRQYGVDKSGESSYKRNNKKNR